MCFSFCRDMNYWGPWEDYDKQIYKEIPKIPTPWCSCFSKIYLLESDWDLPIRWDVCYAAIENEFSQIPA